MANLTSTLTVRLIDAVTAPARAAANSIRGIGSAVDQTNARRMAIAGALDQTTRQIDRATKGISRNIGRMHSGMSMPTGLLGWFGAKSVYDFEKTSNALQAVTNVTDEQRKAVQNLAKELNALFPYNASQIMSAAFELGRAGFEFQQIMGALKGTLNLALAGDIDLQRSADIATNILTAMRLPAKTAEDAAASLERVNDVISYVASSSNTDVGLMGDTLKYVAPLAAVAGVSLEELGAAGMVLAKGGIRGAEAGVALRSALTRMVKPSLDARQAMAELGMSFEDFASKFRDISVDELASGMRNIGFDISPVVGDLQQRLEGMSLENNRGEIYETILGTIIEGLGITRQIDQNKVAKALSRYISSHVENLDMIGLFEALVEKGVSAGYMTRIFDQRQGARLTNLLRDEAGTPELTGAVDNVRSRSRGAADRMARTRMQGVVGDVAALGAAFTNLFIAIADAGVLKTAREVIQSLTDGLRHLAAVNPRLLELGTYAMVLAGILGPLAIALGGVVGMVGTLVWMFRLLGAGAGGAAAVGAAGAGLGGAAAGAAAVAKGGLLRMLFRGAGVVGVGLLGKDFLNLIDPKGNLWGLTSGIDAWFERNLGFNPSRVGGGSASAQELDTWLARQAEIDARLNAIESGGGPAAYHERGRLMLEREALQRQIDTAVPPGDAEGAASSAHQMMSGFNGALREDLQQTEQMVDEAVGRIKEKLNFVARPVIAPRVDGSALRGIHADVGVE